MHSLKQRTLLGFGWSGATQVVRQVLQFAVGIILARILVPDDFGLVAMIIIFTGFANLFTDMGLGTAVVQRKDLEDRHLDAAFWINVLAGVVLAILFVGLAPVAAWFYGRRELCALTMVAALEFLISPLRVVQTALLEREMNFKRLGLVEVTALCAGGATAVVMALNGLGVWSLVARSLVSAAISVVMLWSLSSWRPKFHVEFRALKDLAGFSLNMLGFSAVNYWVRNADNLLVGRYLGGPALGIYARGYNLMLLPITQITRVLSRVMYPTLSSIQDDKDRVRRIYLRALRTISVVTFPIMVGLLAVAKPFVLTVYGEKWRMLIPILQILCLTGLHQSVSGTVGWIYTSQGRTDLMFRWSMYVACITIPSFVIGLHWGVVGVAASYTIAVYTFLLIPSWIIPGRLINLTLGDVCRALAGPMACAAVMGCIVWGAGLMMPAGWPQGLRLACQVPLGVATYATLVFAFRLEGVREIAGIIRSRRGKRARTIE